jgi:hypothetical protein
MVGEFLLRILGVISQILGVISQYLECSFPKTVTL